MGFLQDIRLAPFDFRTEIIRLTKSTENGITTAIANKLITEHNEAYDGNLYGEQLYSSLLELYERGVIDLNEVDKLYFLSVDWPLNNPIGLMWEEKDYS